MLLELEKISDDNLNDIVDKALKSVKNAETEIFKYSKALEVLLKLIEEEVITYDEDLVYQCFLEGLEKFKLQKNYNFNIQILNSLSTSKKEKIQNFNFIVEETLNELDKERARYEQIEIFESAFKKEKRGYFLQEFFRQQFDFSEITFTPKEFFDEALVHFTKVELVSFSSSLRARKEKYTIEKVYEEPWLIKLGEIIEEYLNAYLEKKLTHMYLKEVLITIQNITP